MNSQVSFLRMYQGDFLDYVRNCFVFFRMIRNEDGLADFVFEEVNESFGRMTGLTGVIGRRMSEILPGVHETQPEFVEKHVRVAESGIPERFEACINALGCWFDISLYSPRKGYVLSVFDDITTRKQDEIALIQSEERFRMLFKGHSSAMMVIDPETGNIIDANQASANFYGWSIDELCRMKIMQINTLSPAEIEAEMKSGVSGEKTVFFFRHRLADGSVRNVEVFSNKVLIAGKTLLYSVIHDVTERKQAETQLYRLTRTLLATNSCNYALLHTDNEDELLKKICGIIARQGGYHMVWVGYAEHDNIRSISSVAISGLVGDSISLPQLSLADATQRQGPTVSAIYTGQPCAEKNISGDALSEPWRQEAFRHGHGSILSLPLKNEHEVFGALTICSARPDDFDADETALLTSLADNLAFGISILRNSKAKEIAMEENEKLQAKLLQSQKDEAERVRAEEKKIIAAAREAEKKALAKAREMTRKLREQKKQLEEALTSERLAGEQQRRFQSMISHEYRTPLAIISGNLDIIMLCGSGQFCSHADELTKMKRAIKRLVEVLDISLEQSHFLDSISDSAIQRIEIHPFISDVLDEASFLWPDRFFLDVDKSLDESELMADPRYIKTAIFNLLDNARKYSPSGTPVQVECQKEGQFLVVRIKNQDQLIPTVVGEGLFTKYMRGSNSSNIGGAGVGLWLVRQIVELNKGSITIENLFPGIVASMRLPLADKDGK